MSKVNFRTFKLSDSFLEEFKGKQPKWGFGGLGYVVYKRTYSRLMDDGSQEEFVDTCRRVVEGVYNVQKTHCKNLRLPWDDRKAQKSAQEMFRRMWEFKWLPPGRGMWIMGSPVVDRIGGAALNNCGFISTEEIKEDFAHPFCWMMDMLMLGVGVGFDTKGAGLVKIQEPQVNLTETFVVPDTREGWIAGLKEILNAYVGKGVIKKYDYSQVRPEGAPIKGFGGTSSGPKPLMDLVEEIQKILNPLVGEHITSEVIVDICNLIGKCVVSGNVRRSAEIAFGDPNDEVFLSLKNPTINKEKVYNHRWASNNSIFATVGMDYSKVAQLTSLNGEPGYEWLENAQKYSRMNGEVDNIDHRAKGGNPCLEQTLESTELCCLVETFPANHDSVDDYMKTLKFAYLYAKTVTLIPTHDDKTNMVIMRNRRIGCSQSGIAQAVKKFGRRRFLNDFCDKGYEFIRELDRKYSEWLCVRTSIKVTSVKPSGSISLLVGATPGIHFPHSKYYIRRVRIQNSSPLLEILKSAGYHTESDLYSPNTEVVSFPVCEENFDRDKSEISMWEQLELAAQLQQYWADNQVSITVTFKPEEAKDIKYALELYETRLKGVSFLPIENHGYQQAPYETISENKYLEMIKDISSLSQNIQSQNEVQERFCDGDVCTL